MFKRTTDCVRDSTETLPKLPSTSPCELYGVFPISSLAYVFYYEKLVKFFRIWYTINHEAQIGFQRCLQL